MKNLIEVIFLVLVLTIVAFDYNKKHKRVKTNELEPFSQKDTAPNKKRIPFFKIAPISIVLLLAIGAYFWKPNSLENIIKYFQKEYKSSEVTFDNGLAYLKEDGTLFSGYIKDYELTGKFKNGKREGFHSLKYKYSGEDLPKKYGYVYNKAQGNFQENVQIGEWLFYHKNGQLAAKGNYSGQEKIPINTSMDSIPIANRDGNWEFWFRNGLLAEKGNYKNGKAEGPFEYYFKNGQLKAKGFWFNNLKDGKWEYLLEDGNLDSKGSYENGLKTGNWEFYGKTRHTPVSLDGFIYIYLV